MKPEDINRMYAAILILDDISLLYPGETRIKELVDELNEIHSSHFYLEES